MTPRQQRFVDEYMIDLNATQAAIRAGYSERTAAEQGSRLLRNVKVAAAIQAVQIEVSKRTEVTVDDVVAGMSSFSGRQQRAIYRRSVMIMKRRAGRCSLAAVRDQYTAIGLPGELVAPLNGTGTKTYMNWYTSAEISSSKIKFSWLKMPLSLIKSS